MHTQITFSHTTQFTSFDAEKMYNFIQGNDKEKGKGHVCSFKLLKLIFFFKG